MNGAHVPIKKSPHTEEQAILRRFKPLKMVKIWKSFSADYDWMQVFLDSAAQINEFASISLLKRTILFLFCSNYCRTSHSSTLWTFENGENMKIVFPRLRLDAGFVVARFKDSLTPCFISLKKRRFRFLQRLSATFFGFRPVCPRRGVGAGYASGNYKEKRQKRQMLQDVEIINVKG